MNARHIGGDFTSLLYIAVTSSVFLYKLPTPPNTGGQLRSPWMGDENCVGGRCKRSSSPPQFSSPIHGLLTADRQCLGGGGLGSAPPPTPQAGRVTDSHGGEG